MILLFGFLAFMTFIGWPAVVFFLVTGSAE